MLNFTILWNGIEGMIGKGWIEWKNIYICCQSNKYLFKRICQFRAIISSQKEGSTHVHWYIEVLAVNFVEHEEIPTRRFDAVAYFLPAKRSKLLSPVLTVILVTWLVG